MYRPHFTEEERIARHQMLYNENPPERQYRNRVSAIEATYDNTGLYEIIGGFAAMYIFVEFILPKLGDMFK